MKRTLFLCFLLLVFPSTGAAQGASQSTSKTKSTPAAAKGQTKADVASSAAKTQKKPEMDKQVENSHTAVAVSSADEAAIAVSLPESTPAATPESEEKPHTDIEEKNGVSEETVTVEWGPYTQGPQTGSPLYIIHSDTTHPTPIEGAPNSKIPRGARGPSSHPAIWKSNTEWLSAAYGVNTYGMGGNITVATLRWSTVYWDSVKVHAGAWKRTQHTFASSILGMPFWASARHEFRVGTGIGAGYLKSRKKIKADDSGFEGSGVTAEILKTYLLLPLEASFIYHYKKHLAFYVSGTLAFPLYFSTTFESTRPIDAEDFEISYRPFLGISAGIRL